MGFSQIFMWVLEMGFMASFVILFILIVRGLIMRRFPRKYVYALWLIAGIRLVCPVMASSPVSLFNLQLLLQGTTASIQTDLTGRASDSFGEEEKFSHIEDALKKAAKESYSKGMGAIQEESGSTQEREEGGSTDMPAVPVKGASDMEAVSVQTEGQAAQKVFSFLTVLWLCGMTLFLSCNLYLTIRMKHRLSKAVLYQRNIYECDSIASPFVFGVIHPRIYIPFRLNNVQREYIVRHEQYHICRRDYLVKLAAFLITAVYWFHPLVWIAYCCMVRDMEMSCDEYVLEAMGKDIRQDYSRLLLAFATNTRQSAISLLTFGETDTRKRVKNIMKFKKSRKWMGVLAFLVIAAASIVCLTNGRVEGKRQEGQIEDAGDIIIAENTVNGCKLQLIAKNAVVVEDKASPYNNMYQGKFILKTMKDGAECSELPLSFPETKEKLYFPKNMTFYVRDYNNDGKNNDFALGQPFDGKNMAYQIYTVDDAGRISQYELSTEEQSYFIAAGGEFSQEFEKDKEFNYYTLYQPAKKQEGHEEWEEWEDGSLEMSLLKDMKEIMLSSADTPEHRILAGIEETMPELLRAEVYKGYWAISYSPQKEVTYSIPNRKKFDDVTMRLDFTYENKKLTFYKSKDYGFVLNMPEDRIDEKQARKLVQKFAKAFLGQEFLASDIKRQELPIRYEGEEDLYMYFKDTLGGEYLVDIKHNVLTMYDAMLYADE